MTNQLNTITAQLSTVNDQIDAYLREQTYNYDDLTNFVHDHIDYDNGITIERLIEAINAERDVPVVMTNKKDFLTKWMTEGDQPDTRYWSDDFDRFESLHNMEMSAVGDVEWDVRRFLGDLELTDEQITHIDPREDLVDQLVELFADKAIAFRWDNFYENNSYWTKERYAADFALLKSVKEIRQQLATRIFERNTNILTTIETLENRGGNGRIWVNVDDTHKIWYAETLDHGQITLGNSADFINDDDTFEQARQITADVITDDYESFEHKWMTRITNWLL